MDRYVPAGSHPPGRSVTNLTCRPSLSPLAVAAIRYHSRSPGSTTTSLALPPGPVSDVLVQLGRGIEHDGSVARVDGPGTEIPHDVERMDICSHLSIGRVDDARSSPQDRVTREQGSVGIEVEGDVVGRVSGC